MIDGKRVQKIPRRFGCGIKEMRTISVTNVKQTFARVNRKDSCGGEELCKTYHLWNMLRSIGVKV